MCVCAVCKQTPIRPPQKRLPRSNTRKILAERNVSSTTSSSMATDDSLISHANVSLASTCSSYTDFQVRQCLVLGLSTSQRGEGGVLVTCNKTAHMAGVQQKIKIVWVQGLWLFAHSTMWKYYIHFSDIITFLCYDTPSPSLMGT